MIALTREYGRRSFDTVRDSFARDVEVAMLRRVAFLVSVSLVALPFAVSCSGAGGDGGGATDDGGGNEPSSSSGSDASSAQSTGTFGSSSSGVAPECTMNTECPMGSICEGGMCVPGCANDQPCPIGEVCCDGGCFDPQSDIEHCGTCGNPCPVADNIITTCEMGICGFGGCTGGYSDCDGSPANGCETTGVCACTPGSTQPCYYGDPATQNVGPCVGGMQTCNAQGTGYGACVGQVLPVNEVCFDSIDNDCNGLTDDFADLDADGWTVCDGDCCDEAGIACANPELVNPGAFEFVGNMVDDDCDPGTSDSVPAAACSSAAKFSGVTGLDVINAMDFCQTTTQNPPLPQRKWGVITADFRLANGAVPNATQLSNMQNWQAAVMTAYGNGVTPQKGSTLAGISSGRMRDANDPGYVAPNGGTDFISASSPPPNYLAQHGNALPSSASCYGNCPAGSGANDSINVLATIRVPTNALSFHYDFRFFSSEFWTWSCTIYNDFYLALLTSGHPMIPADKNISFDSANNPVSVNNGFFDVCQVRGCQMCPAGTGALSGTGMENLASHATFGTGMTGGATNWLVTTAPVIPGETITLEFTVFDVSDGVLDSLTILDALEWSINPSGVGTVED